MFRSLWSAATGMTAQQTNIDNIANNLANVNTIGFKKGHIVFEDLLYQDIIPVGAPSATGVMHPTGMQIGLGVRPISIEKIHSQGSPQSTENPLDVAIFGDGYFQIATPDGEIAYTRSGSLKIDANGDIVTPHGYFYEPLINIPEDAIALSISEDGLVSVALPGEDEMVEVGQFEMARFVNPSGLKAVGKSLFLETGASGAPVIGVPGEDGFGTIEQNFLEMSNVNVVDEMVNMITGQRAYEMNAKSITTGDEMLQAVNALKR